MWAILKVRAYNIPYEFYTDDLRKIGEGFTSTSGNRMQTTVLTSGRSSTPRHPHYHLQERGRSIKAVNSAVGCGFSPEKT